LDFHLTVKYRKAIYFLLVVLAFAATLPTLSGRARIERESRSVEIVMDYNDLENICTQEGVPPGEALERLKKAGLTSLSFSETNMEELRNRGRIKWVGGSELTSTLFAADPSGAASSQVLPGAMCILDCPPGLEKSIEENLSLLWGPGSTRKTVLALPGRKLHVLQVVAGFRDASVTGMGFDREIIEKAHGEGFRIVLRPENRNRLGEKGIEAYFRQMGQIPGVTAIVFGGSNEAVGYPMCLDATVEGFRQSGISFGDVEAPNDKARLKGSEYLGLRIPGMTVRVMSITAQHQAKMSVDEAIDKFRLAFRERNIRMAYLRPFASGEKGRDVISANVDYVAGVRGEAAKFGFTDGPASRMPLTDPSPAALVLITMGAAGALLLLLDYFYPDTGLAGILVIGAALVVSAALVLLPGKIHLLQKLTALAISIIFPLYAFTAHFEEMQMVESRRSLPSAIGYALMVLLRITSISVLGGLMMAAAMSSTTFMLSIDKFRGVKAVLILIPALVFLFYYLKGSDRRNTLPGLLSQPLYIWHVVMLGLAGAVGLVYVLRSGNTPGAIVAGEEQELRTALEQLLWVRPRFKEFLLGHPALMLTWAMSYLRYYGGLGILAPIAAIGQADIMDTFAHVHTPLVISLARILIGTAIGAVVGSILICAAWTGRRLWEARTGGGQAPSPTGGGEKPA
jgi:hypothetical protein